MKHRKLIFAIVAVFIILNTQYFWERIFGVSAFVVILFLLFVTIICAILLLRQIIIAIVNKKIAVRKISIIAVSAILLFLIFYYPDGIINFRKLESKELLYAQREGAANCMTTFRLKQNKEFAERTVCFGIREIKGEYTFRNDTLIFKKADYDYKFALIKNSELLLYKNFKDSIPYSLTIITNEFGH
jgi:hypothetical protein